MSSYIYNKCDLYTYLELKCTEIFNINEDNPQITYYLDYVNNTLQTFDSDINKKLFLRKEYFYWNYIVDNELIHTYVRIYATDISYILINHYYDIIDKN